MSPLRRFRDLQGDETGAALVITMMMIGVLTALGVTVFALSTANLGNAGRDRQASSALANSEAGIGNAIAYLKSSGVGKIACAPNCNAANPWGESPQDGDAYPAQSVTLSSNETFDVWFETIQAATGTTAGYYRIHSVGKSGTGPGSRTVEVDIQVAPFKFPLAIYADAVDAGGTGSVHTESLLSKGCITRRSKINFNGIDPVYNIPAGAHSAQYITDSNTSGSTCPSTDNKNIHKDGPCNTTYPYDQDRQGGSLAATTCLGAAGGYPQTSLIADENDLATKYKFDLAGLSSAQLDLLRTAAQEQGFYFTNTAAIPAVLQADSTAINYPSPVLFYDLMGSAVGSTVDLKDIAPTVYARSAPLLASAAGCHGRSVIVVVVNGDVRLNSNSVLTGSVFAMGPSPYGNVNKANGTSTFIGSVYAKHMDLTGTADFHMDDCFMQNLPGSLLSVTATNFREVDR